MFQGLQSKASEAVALLAEGVDRNFLPVSVLPPMRPSPSSRRAWIEISFNFQQGIQVGVALLAEGVDRNPAVAAQKPAQAPSPSSRRAWIEMQSASP